MTTEKFQAVSYPIWKTLVQNHSWTTYYSGDAADDSRTVYSGDRDRAFRATVESENFIDWQTNFEAAGISVVRDDDAYVQIVGLSGLLPQPLNPDGSPTVTVTGDLNVTVVGGIGGAVGQLHLDKWTGTPITIPTAFVVVYTTTTPGVLFDAVWHVDSKDIEVKISIDSLVVLLADLEEFADDFKFSHGDSSPSGRGCCFDWLHEYADDRWRFKVRDVVDFSTLKIEMRKTGGSDKKVERGLTIWRELT